MSSIGYADNSGGHRKVEGVVSVVKGEYTTVKTPTGKLRFNAKEYRGSKQADLKVGDEVLLVHDENNTVIDVHIKGEDIFHRFYTGKLVHMGQSIKEIKLETVGGEKVFPLGRLEIKTKNIKEGAIVTVEINEAGIVIDLHEGDGQH